MGLGELHRILGWIVIGANGFVGAWALAAHWITGLRHRSLWALTAAAQVLLVFQVILGVAHFRRSGIEVTGIHQFYGFLALISVALIYSYRLQIKQWLHLLYGFGGLFIMGLALRAAFNQGV